MSIAKEGDVFNPESATALFPLETLGHQPETFCNQNRYILCSTSLAIPAWRVKQFTLPASEWLHSYEVHIPVMAHHSDIYLICFLIVALLVTLYMPTESRALSEEAEEAR